MREVELRDYFDEASIESIDERLDLERVIVNLSVREKRILYLFTAGYTQAEIGEKMGLSQQRIGQILAGISKKGG